ncbi:MAG: site-specific integrase [Bacteroidetes bacterium]|nr:site-specific integrase [Bacteroidota bacterium]
MTQTNQNPSQFLMTILAFRERKGDSYMYLSKRSNGRYYIYYAQVNGKMTCVSTKTNLKSEALKFLLQFDAQLKDRIAKKVNPVYLGQFFFEFLRYSESVHSINHTKSLRTTFKSFTKQIGNVLLTDLTKEQVVSFVEMRLRNLSAYTVRRDIADLSSAFNYAISKKYLTENPCKSIKKPKLVEKLPLFFTQAEFETLLRAIDDIDLKELVTFAVNTGLRQSDLINLEWRQIDFKNQTLILDNRNSQTKSRKVHTIPLNIKALQILTDRQIRNSQSLKVFTYKDKPIKQLFISHKFKKLVKKAGLDQQLSFHGLRHTFGSWLVQKGVSIYQVSKLLTHSDLRVTQIYTHLRVDDLRSAVEKLD